jgi:hypothetical protein
MSAIWESANSTRQFGILQTGNQKFGMLPIFWDIKKYLICFNCILVPENISYRHSWGSNYVFSSHHSWGNTYEFSSQ